jgi:hypothetical protein
MAERLVREPSERERLTLARTLGVSYKRLHGWTPSERHEHYDPEGNLTGYTLVHREAEWDDDERRRMMALGRYEADCHECGYHWSVLNDTDNVFMPEHRVCPVCRGARRFERIQDNADKAYRKQNEDKPLAPDPSDGRTLYMRQLSPEEAAALREGRRS